MSFICLWNDTDMLKDRLISYRELSSLFKIGNYSDTLRIILPVFSLFSI